MPKIWNLLHESQPEFDDDCYLGFKTRNGTIRVVTGEWRDDDWWAGISCDMQPVFGAFLPLEISIDIYWCPRTSFRTVSDAMKSLQEFLSQ